LNLATFIAAFAGVLSFFGTIAALYIPRLVSPMIFYKTRLVTSHAWVICRSFATTARKVQLSLESIYRRSSAYTASGLYLIRPPRIERLAGVEGRRAAPIV
jgi:hypothetical protein